MSVRVKILIAIALGGILAGVCGAIAYGFRGVSRDCHEWVDSHSADGNHRRALFNSVAQRLSKGGLTVDAGQRPRFQHHRE